MCHNQCWANRRFMNRELQTAILFHLSHVAITVFKCDVGIGEAETFFIASQRSRFSQSFCSSCVENVNTWQVYLCLSYALGQILEWRVWPGVSETVSHLLIPPPGHTPALPTQPWSGVQKSLSQLGSASDEKEGLLYNTVSYQSQHWNLFLTHLWRLTLAIAQFDISLNQTNCTHIWIIPI